ncbi:MAG TPA: hypothetical protein VFA21_01145 [Pyrinomonadaceae bacterium]|jgi:hypothetical protein|nr:hypothetical protein [Pyrinomonadaceae bacterium]
MNTAKYAEDLGAPDFKLAGLQVWIHGRQFPDADDYWDGNWLNVTARCSSSGADVLTSGPILHAPDLTRWLAALEEMGRTLSGGADLVSLEPELSVEMKMETLGHVAVKVEITPDHMTQEHTFRFEVDQSYLKPLIEDCRRVVAKYPVKGKLDSEQ